MRHIVAYLESIASLVHGCLAPWITVCNTATIGHVTSRDKVLTEA